MNGILDIQAIHELERHELVSGIGVKHCGVKLNCEICLQGKMARSSFPKSSRKKSKAVLDLVHSDLCGPMNTVTPGGRRYFLTFIDDFSRYSTVYLLREKSETFEALKDFVQQMKTQFGRPPKIVRSDQGGENLQQFTVANTPQQNGVAERKNRSLVEMARCLILDSGMHYRYWGEAINTANYLQNIFPSKSVQKIPYEIWNDSKPDLERLLSHKHTSSSRSKNGRNWIPSQSR